MRLKARFSVLSSGVGESRERCHCFLYQVIITSVGTGGASWEPMGLCSPTRGGRRCGECGLGAAGEELQGRPRAIGAGPPLTAPGGHGLACPEHPFQTWHMPGAGAPSPAEGCRDRCAPPEAWGCSGLPPASPPAMLLERLGLGPRGGNAVEAPSLLLGLGKSQRCLCPPAQAHSELTLAG